MLRVLLASRNQGKLREFAELLPDFTLLPWPGEAPDLPETGAFFQDNALQKAEGARAWWEAHGMEPVDAVLADDSGLCVDALWGGPGVLSARFAPDAASYGERNQRLLAMIPGGAGRGARFVCVLALVPLSARAGQVPFTVSGTVEGHLAPEARGCQGFGYDPLFIPDGAGLTFGELSPEAKHSLSHRARACAALTARLREGA